MTDQRRAQGLARILAGQVGEQGAATSTRGRDGRASAATRRRQPPARRDRGAWPRRSPSGLRRAPAGAVRLRRPRDRRPRLARRVRRGRRQAQALQHAPPGRGRPAGARTPPSPRPASAGGSARWPAAGTAVPRARLRRGSGARSRRRTAVPRRGPAVVGARRRRDRPRSLAAAGKVHDNAPRRARDGHR